jgi:hypothetical protein
LEPSSSVKKSKKDNKAARVLLAIRTAIVNCLQIVIEGKYPVLGEFTTIFAIEVQFTTAFPYPTPPPPPQKKETGKENRPSRSWSCIHLLCMSVPLYIVK